MKDATREVEKALTIKLPKDATKPIVSQLNFYDSTRSNCNPKAKRIFKSR